MNHLATSAGWMLPSQDEADDAVRQARRLFAQAHARWVGDLLTLRSGDFLSLRWTDEAEETWRLAA